jgi:hypothetical protein
MGPYRGGVPPGLPGFGGPFGPVSYLNNTFLEFPTKRYHCRTYFPALVTLLLEQPGEGTACLECLSSRLVHPGEISLRSAGLLALFLTRIIAWVFSVLPNIWRH